MRTIAVMGRDEMDKQTAVDLLDNLLGMVEDNHDSDYDTAIKMGIDALQSNAPNALSALDCVGRQAALEAMDTWDKYGCDPDGKLVRYDDDKHYVPYVHYEDMAHAIKHLPSVQPTLYGYKIEHLAYIARVMEKEGVTAEYAVRTFDDISRAVRMIMEEAQQKAEELLKEQFNQRRGEQDETD